MNNTFNLNRFGLLLKRQWLEFGKIYLISLLVILGVIIAFYSFNLFYDQSNPIPLQKLRFREPGFLILGFIFITIIANSYFAHLGQKQRAVIDLMIPASTFEKFAAGIFFTAILSLISFILVFFFTDLVFISAVRENLALNLPADSGQSYYLFAQYYNKDLRFLYAVPVLFTSIFLLGSVYFNRFHYIKTAVVVMIFVGVWSYITFKIAGMLTSNKTQKIYHSNGKEDALMLLFLITVVLALVFWAITYVRLKEKEV